MVRRDRATKNEKTNRSLMETEKRGRADDDDEVEVKVVAVVNEVVGLSTCSMSPRRFIRNGLFRLISTTSFVVKII
jgi:hypothetical protein